jgi:ribosomal protein S18 acetylase RimI-like enzyme
MEIDFNKITIRDTVKQNDVEVIREITESTGFFPEDEVKIAVELIEERLQKGLDSGYLFNFLEYKGRVIGYTCFGLIPLSHISYDLYWIVIHNDFRNKGLGKYLMKKMEDYIKAAGGIQIYVDTSSKKQYLPTRKYYKKSGYKQIAFFKDFFDYGDGKVVFYKKLK